MTQREFAATIINRKFYTLIELLERAQAQRYDIDIHEFLTPYYSEVTRTIDLANRRRGELVVANDSLYRIENLLSEEGRERWREYRTIERLTGHLEIHIRELVDKIPTHLRIYMDQISDPEIKKSLIIIQKLISGILETIGYPASVLPIFGDDYTYYPLVGNNLATISIPISMTGSIAGWLPIAHEIGHFLYDKLFTTGLREEVERLALSISEVEIQEQEYDWINEIFCDAFMAEIFSLQAHLYHSQRGLFTKEFVDTREHPPYQIRLTMIGKYLRKRILDPNFPRGIGDLTENNKRYLIQTSLWHRWIMEDFLEGLVDIFISTFSNLGLIHNIDRIINSSVSLQNNNSTEETNLAILVAAIAELELQNIDTSDALNFAFANLE